MGQIPITSVPENMFFCYPSAVWASASCAFCIVSDIHLFLWLSLDDEIKLRPFMCIGKLLIKRLINYNILASPVPSISSYLLMETKTIQLQEQRREEAWWEGEKTKSTDHDRAFGLTTNVPEA